MSPAQADSQYTYWHPTLAKQLADVDAAVLTSRRRVLNGTEDVVACAELRLPVRLIGHEGVLGRQALHRSIELSNSSLPMRRDFGAISQLNMSSCTTSTRLVLPPMRDCLEIIGIEGAQIENLNADSMLTLQTLRGLQ